jgi:hypothetical protein
MAVTTKRTFSGKGKVHVGPYGGGGPLGFVGNCSDLTFEHTENKTSIGDFTTPGGGEYDSIRRVDAVTLSSTRWDILDPTELSRSLRGTASEQSTTTPIVSEPHTAYKGGLIVLSRLPDHSQTITVVDAGTGGYVEGTDYLRTAAGITVLTGGNIADEATLEISYTPLISDTVEALTSSGETFRLVFEGLNEADSDRPVVIEVHKFKPGVPGSMSWLSQEFLSMQAPGDVQKDTSIVGDALSKFYRVRIARPTA